MGGGRSVGRGGGGGVDWGDLASEKSMQESEAHLSDPLPSARRKSVVHKYFILISTSSVQSLLPKANR